MADGHHEFEQLAVEHVLGGLDPAVSSKFRDHLIDCRLCRQRVAELRGIAADLDVAAREERAAVRIKTETARRDEESSAAAARAEPEFQGWLPSPIRNFLLLSMAVLVAVISFWNIHLRQVEATLQHALEVRAEVLDVLAVGDVVPLETSTDGLEAQVATTRAAVAVNATGVPALRGNERLVLWGLLPGQDDAVDDWRLLALADAIGEGGRVVLLGELLGHDELQLTVEVFPVGVEPLGTVLFTARIP